MVGRPGARTRLEAVLLLLEEPDSPAEVAHRLGIQRKTLRKWCAEARPLLIEAWERRRERKLAAPEGNSPAALPEELRRLRMRCTLLECLLRDSPPSAGRIAALDRATPYGTAPVRDVCSWLGLPRSSYYAARRVAHAPRDAEALHPPTCWTADEDARREIRRILRANPAWGVRKVHNALISASMRISRRRVWRLLGEMRGTKTRR